MNPWNNWKGEQIEERDFLTHNTEIYGHNLNVFRPFRHLECLPPKAPTNTSLDSDNNMIPSKMNIYGAHFHTQIPEGQVEGRAVYFKEPFVKSLLKFINKK